MDGWQAQDTAECADVPPVRIPAIKAPVRLDAAYIQQGAPVWTYEREVHLDVHEHRDGQQAAEVDAEVEEVKEALLLPSILQW